MDKATEHCAAVYDGGIRCPDLAEVREWCYYHWHQQNRGIPFTARKRMPPRPAVVRGIQCTAVYGGNDRCPNPNAVLEWCRYHWRQQREGKPFTAHRARRPRGSDVARDGIGRKQCARCCNWKPESAFTPSSKARDGLQSWCSSCAADYMSFCRYGITRTQVEEMVAAQGGCAVCGSPEPRGTSTGDGWHVDHDHGCCQGPITCGRCVRAVLCGPCNLLIGYADDSPKILQLAIDYLAHSGRRASQWSRR